MKFKEIAKWLSDVDELTQDLVQDLPEGITADLDIALVLHMVDEPGTAVTLKLAADSITADADTRHHRRER